MQRKSIAWLLLALVLASVPLTTGCWQCEGGARWTPYARDMAAVTLDAATPVSVPLVVSVPMSSDTDDIAIEVALTDCTAGALTLGARMLRGDGTALVVAEGGGTSGTIRCPATTGVVFEIPPADLTCAAGRCVASLTVELTSSASIGPREIEARIDNVDCRSPVRGDARIDAWGN